MCGRGAKDQAKMVEKDVHIVSTGNSEGRNEENDESELSE